MNRILTLMVFCVLTSSYAGLIAYFPFNGTANDESGHGYSGVVNGAVLTVDRFGYPASAYRFDGTNDFITVDIADLPSSGSPRTLTVWVMPTRPVANDGVIRFVGYGAQNSNGQFGLGIFDYARGQTVYFMQGYSTWKPPLPVPTAQWAFVAVTYSNNIVTMSLNGANFVTKTNPLNTINNGRFFFGVQSMDGIQPSWSAGNWDRWFCGVIDDVRLYDSALTPEEIQRLYELESGPRVALMKAVKPEFLRLSVGSNYQVQVSGDAMTWTNEGAPFIATSTNMVYPQFFEVSNWAQLFFRVQKLQ